MTKDAEPIHTEQELMDACWVAFQRGAQAMRETIARVDVPDVRAIWNTEWGPDPGTPSEEHFRKLETGFDYGACIF